MKENNIQAEFVRKMQRKTRMRQQRKQVKIKYPDLVNRNFKAIKEQYQVLFTDVTYLVWNGQRQYQSTIIDAYTKEIIDFKISRYNDTKLVLENLNDALEKIKSIKNDLKGIIIHSDHGYQYTSQIYHDKCISNGIIISMGKNYNCTDNIIIESFHSLLKKGTIHNNNYSSLQEYVNDVIDWNLWYQNKKLVSTFNCTY